jgi:hypothetical protein
MMHAIETASLTLEPQTAAQRLESRRSADGQEQWLNCVIRLPTSELIGYVQATVDANGRAAIAYEFPALTGVAGSRAKLSKP